MIVVSLLALLLPLAPGEGTRPLTPRRPLPEQAVRAQAIPGRTLQQRLIVKFADGLRVRARAGALRSGAGGDLEVVSALARERGITFSPLIRLPEATLSGLEARAAERSGRAQPDLAGMAIVHLPGTTTAALEEAGRALQLLPQVEFVHIQTLALPPPGDIPPSSGSHVHQQAYRRSDPGLDVNYAWSLGARGAGVRLSDCEYGWNASHEDLNDLDLHLEPGQTIAPGVFANGWDEHGTAVLGATSAMDNAYGCSGLVPDAEVHTYPEWTVQEGARRVTAITHAIASSGFGDVVLLEMQTLGAGGDLGPAELNPAVWTVCRTGTDAGVVIVGAAGNGNQNLDAAAYASYRARGDSGAVIVGAGSPTTSHDKLSFSTYGARVNLQGWGGSVFTLGYGYYITYGGDDNQAYTAGFNGTSSASALVAGCCVAVQAHARQLYGQPLAPEDLRQHLIATGRPQGSGGHIGPLVDLRAALDTLPPPAPRTYCLGKRNSLGCRPTVSWSGTPSTTDPAPFRVIGNDLMPNANGFLLYTIQGRASLSYHNGTLCVKAPFRRFLPLKNSGSAGGGRCPGELRWNFNQRIQGGGDPLLTLGRKVNAQFHYRDVGVDAFNDGLTNGIEFLIGP